MCDATPNGAIVPKVLFVSFCLSALGALHLPIFSAAFCFLFSFFHYQLALRCVFFSPSHNHMRSNFMHEGVL